MVRTDRTTLRDVADWNNLASALGRAAQGKRNRPEVARFLERWTVELALLQRDLLEERVELERPNGFWIHEPKRRRIEAPAFRERVLHHALVGQLEPAFERTLIDDTFACRKGKGCLAAVHRAQAHLRRHAWSVQVDVRAYYRSVDHDRLEEQLARLFRDRGVRRLLGAVLAAYAAEPRRGLPIGALTSQHLGNFHLAPVDRFLLQDLRVGGVVRYMDDLTWFVDSREEARAGLAATRAFVRERLGLELHRERIQRCERGLTLLGYRIQRGRLGLSARRRRRYRRARRRWEQAYRLGLISGAELQRAYDSVLAVTAHADVAEWRRRDLERVPAPDA